MQRKRFSKVADIGELQLKKKPKPNKNKQKTVSIEGGYFGNFGK